MLKFECDYPLNLDQDDGSSITEVARKLYYTTAAPFDFCYKYVYDFVLNVVDEPATVAASVLLGTAYLKGSNYNQTLTVVYEPEDRNHPSAVAIAEYIKDVLNENYRQAARLKDLDEFIHVLENIRDFGLPQTQDEIEELNPEYRTLLESVLDTLNGK